MAPSNDIKSILLFYLKEKVENFLKHNTVIFRCFSGFFYVNFSNFFNFGGKYLPREVRDIGFDTFSESAD